MHLKKKIGATENQRRGRMGGGDGGESGELFQKSCRERETGLELVIREERRLLRLLLLLFSHTDGRPAC